MTNNKDFVDKEKILLMLLPFWAPLNPPLGITSLKSYLNEYRYQVTTIDVNIESDIWGMRTKYIKVLQSFVPNNRMGNFNMISYDVFMSHLMVHLHYQDMQQYQNIVQMIVAKNFFIDLNDIQTQKLIQVVTIFYELLEKFLLEIFDREKPTIFGATVYNVTLAPSLFAFRLMKERDPNIKTVMGGGVYADLLSINSPNFELLLEKAPYVDTFIVGEGEVQFLEYLRGNLPDKRVYTINDLQGNQLDLAETKIPDYSDLDLDKYTQLASYASRSCPFQCSFCSETVQWGKYRKKKATQIIDELVTLQEKHGFSIFMLGDSLINPFVTPLAKEMIERKAKIYWDGYLRADKPVCKPEKTMLWRQSGFYRARLGIESGSQHVLDLMNKNITVEQIKKAISSLAQAGIKTTTYWVIGHPGETEEDFQATLDLIEECKYDIYEADFHPFYYFPTGQVNSEVWKEESGITALYPEEALELLITQTWFLNTKPTREEIYDRVCRFEEHCAKHNIPNPYSLREIFLADERWKELHENAVPSLIELIS